MARDPYRYFRVEARELLDQLGKGTLDLEKGKHTPELVALLLRSAHTLKGAARVVKQAEIADRAHAIEDVLAPFRGGDTPVSRAAIEALLAALDDIGARLNRLGAAAPGKDDAPAPMAAALREATPVPVPQQGPSMEPASHSVDDIDVLLDGLSEASVQVDAIRAAPGSRAVGQALEQLERELGQVRDAAERLRLIPASLMFVPLERAARDAARSLGKRIEFLAGGGEVRLDAQVFGGVQGALLQVIRNAVAHGIESPAERAAAGKPADGHIAVEVSRRDHRIHFLVRDDGRGVDLDGVRRALAEKELLPSNAAELGPEELLKLLLGAGISTSGGVTQIAGRGIGLDIVRDAVRRLRGEVRWHTGLSRGTTFTIEVPVSLAAVDALLVETGGRVVGIPLESVRRTLRVGASELAASPQGPTLSFEGKVIPFAPLDRALQRSARPAGRPRAWSAVIVQGASALGAVGVERLRGTQNLVLRPMPEHTPADPIVAGASLNAQGNAQLILDPKALVEFVHRGQGFAAEPDAPRLPILIVDDSLTTRMLEQSILESAGYQADLAVSGEDGLERARQRRYALILVDVEMPGMDGFSFIERLRADAALGSIPAILVTSRASAEDRRRGLAAGAQEYIVKGEFDQNDLLAKIRSLIEAP